MNPALALFLATLSAPLEPNLTIHQSEEWSPSSNERFVIFEILDGPTTVDYLLLRVLPDGRALEPVLQDKERTVDRIYGSDRGLAARKKTLNMASEDDEKLSKVARNDATAPRWGIESIENGFPSAAFDAISITEGFEPIPYLVVHTWKQGVIQTTRFAAPNSLPAGPSGGPGSGPGLGPNPPGYNPNWNWGGLCAVVDIPGACLMSCPTVCFHCEYFCCNNPYFGTDQGNEGAASSESTAFQQWESCVLWPFDGSSCYRELVPCAGAQQ